MSVYVFSLLINYVPNGVDNAQGTRSKYLNQLHTPIKYFYTNVPCAPYIKRYTDTGIPYKDMHSIHLLLSGNSAINADEITSRNIYAGNYLIAQEHYSDRLLYTNYYQHIDGTCFLCKQTFHNIDSSIAYEVLYNDNDPKSETYVFPSGAIYTKSEFLELAFKSININTNDLILIDRPGQLDFVEPLFRNSNGAKIVVFLHSCHYFEHMEDPDYNYLNPEYNYWFKYSKYINSFIVSTEAQKDELIQILNKYNCHIPNIEVIPACGIAKLTPSMKRNPYSMLTVSRHDARKKLDWLILSVIKAHSVIPEITLDLYGRGDDNYTDKLAKIIEDNDAQSYINIKGYTDVRELYKNYEAYITCSTWETLGITLLEATASGNALIGLNTKYGNMEFIKDEINGYLTDIDFEKINSTETNNSNTNQEYIDSIINDIADSIVELFNNPSKLRSFHTHSYQIAKNYLEENISAKWISFFNKMGIE